MVKSEKKIVESEIKQALACKISPFMTMMIMMVPLRYFIFLIINQLNERHWKNQFELCLVLDIIQKFIELSLRNSS